MFYNMFRPTWSSLGNTTVYGIRGGGGGEISNIKHRKKKINLKKVKCSRYRPGVAQRVGTGIAPLFHDRGTRRG